MKSGLPVERAIQEATIWRPHSNICRKLNMSLLVTKVAEFMKAGSKSPYMDAMYYIKTKLPHSFDCLLDYFNPEDRESILKALEQYQSGDKGNGKVEHQPA